MKYIINGVNLPINSNEDDLLIKIAKEVHIEPKHFSYKILKKSIDARKGNVNFVYNVVIETPFYLKRRNIIPYKEPPVLKINKSHLKYRPVIVGFGPCGMFAGLYLARAGAKPIILERGKCVEERKLDVEELKNKGILNTESNVCYGEGGAGTFSDGKLNTGVHNGFTKFILEEFVKHGAKEDILIDSSPHIGSDYLQNIVRNFRNEIISLGGEILFNTKFNNLIIQKGKVIGAKYEKDKCSEIIDTDKVILAIGHSPLDTTKQLLIEGLTITPKDFSIGVRIEHLQRDINKTRYHDFANDKRLPNASYKCVSHLSNGRTIYSFCMCPGGTLINSSTDINTVVTNGMSNNDRALPNGNSALLIPVKVKDYFRSSALDGFDFRHNIEQSIYRKDKPYFAPIQLVNDFIEGKISEKINSIKPSYLPGVYFASLDKYLPTFISDSLKEGLLSLGKQLDFMNDKDAILTGFETRSSSPISIPRNENMESNIIGLYPCGEGASYAGGITSAALDGLKVALKILEEVSN